MKRVALTSLFLLLVGIGLGFGRPSVFQSSLNHQSNNQQLGVEITTNTGKETLYLPVSMTRGKGLIATVPVAGGGAVSAVRITPVMENGKVKLDVFLVSGNYSQITSTDDLKQLLAVKVSTRVAAKGETLVVRDEMNNAPWSVSIKAVDRRDDAAAAREHAQFLKTGPNQMSREDYCDMDCVYCFGGVVCPLKGQCIMTHCGMICCDEGGEID